TRLPASLLCATHLPLLPSHLLQACLPPRDLHSLPTRRSSDLGRVKVKCGRLTEKEMEEQFYIHPGALVIDATHPYAAEVTANIRSEEHTSELQSRFDLVCRLLLEKKNTARHSPCLSNDASSAS